MIVQSEVEDEGLGQAIQDLIGQGAELHSTTDKTGETSLHLAARHARADAAKRLLDAGADPNCPDGTGRTPLHSSIAADAQGVFQILLRNRATDLNARTNEGTTPLILAARLAIEGMVEALITADADINAADDQGKSALHWAAAVNNIEAVQILLSSGANKDATDNKEETPLFLAAREGSYEACQVLLDAGANRDMADHMDQTPRDVAQERMHGDIVRLMEEPRQVHHHRSKNMLSSNGTAAMTATLPSAARLAKMKKNSSWGDSTSPPAQTPGELSPRRPSLKAIRRRAGSSSPPLAAHSQPNLVEAVFQLDQNQQPPPIPPKMHRVLPSYEEATQRRRSQSPQGSIGAPRFPILSPPGSATSTSSNSSSPPQVKVRSPSCMALLPPASQVHPAMAQRGSLADFLAHNYLTPSPDSPYSAGSHSGNEGIGLSPPAATYVQHSVSTRGSPTPYSAASGGSPGTYPYQQLQPLGSVDMKAGIHMGDFNSPPPLGDGSSPSHPGYLPNHLTPPQQHTPPVTQAPTARPDEGIFI